MKTKLIKIIIGSNIALVITLAFALNAQADGQIKGAQLLLQPSQTTVAAASASEAKMNCAACKNVPTENVRIEKGHIRTVTVSQKHLCAKCSTTIGVVGEGKAKKDVTTHTCSAPSSGCGMMAGT